MNLIWSTRTEDTMPIVRVTGNCQMTIPAGIRKALGVKTGDYVEVKLAKDAAIFKPVEMVPKKVMQAKKRDAEDEAWARLGEEEILKQYDEKDSAYDNIKP